MDLSDALDGDNSSHPSWPGNPQPSHPSWPAPAQNQPAWPGPSPGGGSAGGWPGPSPGGGSAGGWPGPSPGGGSAGAWPGPSPGGGNAGGWPGPSPGGGSAGGWPGPSPGGGSAGGWPGPSPGGGSAGGWPGPSPGGGSAGAWPEPLPGGGSAGAWPGPSPGGGSAGGLPGPQPVGPVAQPSKPLVIPYSHPFPGGLHDKMLITILGTVNKSPNKFAVDLHRDHDIAFHFNPRFNENGHKVIVRNSCIDKKWGQEERQLRNFPFSPGAAFEIKILCTQKEFKVSVNNSHLLEFKHRIPNLRSITRLCIHNDISLRGFKVETLP